MNQSMVGTVYLLSCVVCDSKRDVCGYTFDHAFMRATTDGSGWTYREGDAFPRVEMLCPEHADG